MQKKINKYFKNPIFLYLFLSAFSSFMALLLAYISEFVFNLQPCILCYYQRKPCPWTPCGCLWYDTDKHISYMPPSYAHQSSLKRSLMGFLFPLLSALPNADHQLDLARILTSVRLYQTALVLRRAPLKSHPCFLR